MNLSASSPLRLTELYWRGIILTLSVSVILFTVWCLSQGITTIFMHLYYFPIVLLAYRYRFKGCGLATLLALTYLGLVIVFDNGEPDLILGALYRFFVFVGIAAVIAYLSERLNQARISRQQSTELREKYLSLAPAIIVAIDRNGAITFLNRKGGEILECRPDDVIGKSWAEEFLPEKDRERVNRVFLRMMTGDIEPNRVFENPVMTRTGAEKIIRWNNSVLHDETGAITGVLGFGEDITEEKWANNALREMQQFQESVIANANVWISVLDPDGTLLVWNDAAEAISGYKKTDVLGKNTVWKQLYPDTEYRRGVTAEIKGVIGRDTYLENFETEIRCADGTKKSIIWNTRGQRDNAGTVTSYIAIGRDVTAQKSAEFRAGESARFLATMIDTLPMPIFFKDAGGKYLGCNPPFEEYIGIKRDDLIGKTAYDISPKDLADQYTAADRQVFENPVPQRYDTQVQYADGSRHDVIFYKAPFFNKNGSVAGLIGAFLDITERKRMEDTLKQSESFNRGLIENLPEYLCVYGLDGRILYVNPASAKTLGYEADALVGTYVLSYIAEEYRDTVKNKIAARLKGDRSSYEIELVLKDGSRRSVLVKATAIQYQNNPAILLLLIDITERKKVEDALALEKQRMESLLALSQMSEKSDTRIISEVVEDAIRLTGSTIGYLATLNDDESVMTMQYWSKSAHESCSVIDKPIVYAVEKTGLWGEAVRQRKSVITNDYAADSPFKRGTPKGHVPLVRHMNIPVFDGDHIVAIAGVGNKGMDYNEGDVRQLQLLMQGWWQIEVRKRAEEALRNSEAYIKVILDSLPVGVAVNTIDPTISFTYMNDNFVRFYRTTREALARPDAFWDVVYEDPVVRDMYKKKVLDDCASGDPSRMIWPDIPITRKGEETTFVTARNVQIPEKNLMISTVWDVTDRKRAEEALEENRQLLTEAMDLAHLANWEVDIVAGIFTFNDPFYAMYGTTAEREGGYQMPVETFIREFIHPDDAGKIADDINKAIQSTDPRYESELEQRIIRRDGVIRYINVQIKITKDAAGRTVKAYGANQDITERKMAGLALHDSEERYRTVLENVPDLVLVHRNGIILYINPPVSDVMGYEPDELINKQITDFIVPAYLPLVAQGTSLRMDGKNVDPYEVEILTKSGKRLTVAVRGSLIDFSGAPASLNVLTDITERKRAEVALRESETKVKKKLAAILEPEGDISVLELSDIIDSEAIQNIMDDFYSLTGIGVAILDNAGKILVATGWQEICTDFHRVNPETCKYCLESDLTLSHGVEPGTFKRYKCKNNLWDIATPVMVGGNQLGNLFLGQFFFDDEKPNVEIFRALAKQHGFDEEKYLSALDQVPRFSHDTVDKVMKFYTTFTDLVSTLSYSNVKLARTLAERDTLVQSLNASEEKIRIQALRTQKLLDLNRMKDVPFLEMLTFSLEACLKMTSSRYSFIGLMNPDESVMSIHSWSLDVMEECAITGKALDFPIKSIGVLGECIRQRAPFVLNNYSTPHPAKHGLPKGHVPITCYLSVPLFDGERIVAVIAVANKEQDYDEGDTDALINLGNHLWELLHRREAEVALRESRQLFSDIISFLPDPTFVIDKDGKVLAWNRALEQLSGIPAGEIIGKGNYEYCIWQYKKRRPLLIDLVLRPDLDIGEPDYTDVRREGTTVTAQTVVTSPVTGQKIPVSLVASPLIDSQGNTMGAIESMRDISNVKEAEAELARLNANLELTVKERTQTLQDEVVQRMQAENDVKVALDYTRSVIEANPDLVVVLDKAGVILDVNAAGELLTGIPKEQLIGTPYFGYLVDDGTHTDKYSCLLKDGNLENIVQIRRTDGHTTPLSVHATVIRGMDGTHDQIIVAAHDITRQKQDEEAIRSSQQMLTNILENFPGIVFWKDKNSVYLGCNRNFSDGAGLKDPLEIAGKTDFDLPWAKTEAESYRSLDRDVMDGEKPRLNIIETQLQSDGRSIWLDTSKIPLFGPDGTVIGIIGTSHDITRQKHDEEAIKASLEEKVILLREVHHRVKNNLQIIISLVNLQMRQTEDPEVKQIMSETQNRVRAMSLVHEKLYRSESLSRIDFADYTRFLATQLFSFYGVDTRRVGLDFAMGKIMMDINTAVPIGLLMNELISNALKHAFPQGREGTIKISGGEKGDLITLSVQDNGVGMPADLDWKNTTSLGMRLVTSLSDQVDGTVTLDREKGTAFTITIKREPETAGKE
ncbi:MAG: PAS domain S-box protein [Methanoregula sp.]|nr:PAS domain S-box protein [Methanoregula sp.]